ncbi:hypothetical protein TWF730_002718 [Orbilia blumenaviensis]|uniref:Uncharacterized protein n=1 Tax=Orbilia blumenaviensis TaxID=1796055 RepID=A0AAV9U770_9PEZI
MKSQSLIILGAALATVTAIPVEGVEGGIVVQGGNADTRLGMFFKPIKNILEKASGKGDRIEDFDTEGKPDGNEDAQDSDSDNLVAEILPSNSVHEEMIVIMETLPTAPELVMPGLLNILSPQRISPPSPVEQALDAVEQVLEGLRHSGFAEGNGIEVNGVGIPERVPEQPSGLPDLLSMLEPMIEPNLPRMNAGETVMIEIV